MLRHQKRSFTRGIYELRIAHRNGKICEIVTIGGVTNESRGIESKADGLV